MRAYGYIRVSSIEQTKGTSLSEQRKQIESYATMMNIELVDVIVDPAIKGEIHISERPQGKRLIEAINTGAIDTVIVCKLDRAFRSASDCLVCIEEWEKKGIGLVILSISGQTIDTSNPAGKLWITMLAGFAEFEKNLIKERCASGRASRKAEGKAIGGTPFGYQKDDNGYLVADVAEQQIIAEIRGLHAQGLSLNAIARRFNSQGVGTKSGGGRWTPATVGRILKAA